MARVMQIQRRSSLYCTTGKFKKLVCDKQRTSQNDKEYAHVCCSPKCNFVFFTSIEVESKVPSHDHNVLIFNKASFSTPKHQKNINGVIKMKYCTQCGGKLRKEMICNAALSPSYSSCASSMTFDTETSYDSSESL